MRRLGFGRTARRNLQAGAFLLAFVGLLAHANEGVALQRADGEEVTYAKDVALILQENCQVCHRSGSIGPMSLMTYEEVRPWAPLIRERVLNQDMPPYQYDTDVGIQDLKYDPRLDEEDIRTIVAWVDRGAPMGDLADLPPPREWPDPAEFRLAERFGPPDVVVRSEPYDVPAAGQDRWWQPTVASGVETDRCIKAIETKPSVAGRASTHHANSTLRVPGGSRFGTRLSEYAMGKIGEIIPEGSCRTLPANAQVSWDIHYFPNGAPSAGDQVEIGIWFYPEDYQGAYRQILTLYFLNGGTGGRGYDIPPGGTLMTQGFQSFSTPVRIDSWQPHGHTRLVAMSLQILRATGRMGMASMVSNWSAFWHHSHMYGDDSAPLLRPGDQLVLTAWYDNSTNNRYNPDADQWVSIGDRTADEMSHAWVAVTHLDQEGFDRIEAERQEKARLASDADR